MPGKLALLWLAIGVVVGLNGCDRDASASRTTKDHSKVLTSATPAAEEIRTRAAELWAARVAEDWAVAFDFVDAETRGSSTPAEYAQWCRHNEPFRIHSFVLGAMAVDGDIGWVQVTSDCSVRKFPQAPSQSVERWEKWRRMDGRWYPVPQRKDNQYPVAPALRNLAEEPRLRARFDESCTARVTRQWDTLFDMCDPQAIGKTERARFASINEALTYLACDVRWVEVVGDRGVVMVETMVGMSDPNLTKSSSTPVLVIERWIRRDGQWYLTLESIEEREICQ